MNKVPRTLDSERVFATWKVVRVIAEQVENKCR